MHKDICNPPKTPGAGRWSGPHCAASDRCVPLKEKEREPTPNNKQVRLLYKTNDELFKSLVMDYNVILI